MRVPEHPAAPTVDDWWLDAPFVRVVGDLHGMHDSFLDAVRDARRRGGKVFCLGDFINRGPDSAGCMALALRGAGEGWLDFVPGNHDHRLILWRHAPEFLDAGDKGVLRSTLEEIDALGDLGLVDSFCEMALDAPVWRREGNTFFAHAMVCDASMTPPTLRQSAKIQGDIGAMAVWGPAIPTVTSLDVGWLDAMPEDSVTFLGHIPLSKETPGKITSRNGAVGVFMDTGCGLRRNAGPLSWVDVAPNDLLRPKAVAALFPEGDATEFNNFKAAQVAMAPR
jgi:hypothetical protein